MLGIVVVALGSGTIGCGDDSLTLDIVARDVVLIAAQDGDGPWQALTPDAEGRVSFTAPSGRYGLAHLCSADGLMTPRFLRTMIVLGTEGGEQKVACGASESFVRLTGTTAPGARIAADMMQATADPSGTYTLEVRPGTHDVVAWLRGTPDLILLERAVDLQADRTLDLPVASAGVEMPMMTPTIAGAAPAVAVFSDLNTAHEDYVFFTEAPMTVPVPPASLLIAGDQPAIGARSVDCVAQEPVGAAAPTLELPSPFVARLDSTMATWQADPTIAWDEVAIALTSSAGGPSLQLLVFAKSSWIDAAGAGDVVPLADLASLPGWEAAMATFVTGQELRWSVAANRGHYARSYQTCSKTGSLTW